MKYHVTAHDKHGADIPGDLEGQQVFKTAGYQRTRAYAALTKGRAKNGNLLSIRVKEWRVTAGDGTFMEAIPNPYFKETDTDDPRTPDT